MFSKLFNKLRKSREQTLSQLPPADEEFDPQWYLSQYPDVARAGMDPWQHYCLHGRAEGRQPCRNLAQVYDHHLWRGLDDIMEVRLQRFVDGAGSGREADYGRWALARWRAWQGDWPAVTRLLAPLTERALIAPAHGGPVLLFLEASLRQREAGRKLGGPVDSKAVSVSDVLQLHDNINPHTADWPLARCNLADFDRGREDPDARFAALNEYYNSYGLQPLSFRPGQRGDGLFDRLQAHFPPGQAGAHTPQFSDGTATAQVSVVVPVFNAGLGLETALRSLHQQTWPSLDVVVVDDASTDDSAQWAARLCDQLNGPGRIFRLIRHTHNQGAYAARNTGIQAASGEFLTVQDADDWSHPAKLQRQVEALQANPQICATVSHWVRADERLMFSNWRIDTGWVHRNVSSLMIRRSVLELLGYWDEVRVNADTEYYYRLLAAFGPVCIDEVMPGIPLAFGRMAEGSLSQAGVTHLVTQFSGVRKQYMDAAHRWHASARGPADLYLARGQRAFAAPRAILPAAGAAPSDQPLGGWLADDGPGGDRHLQDWCQQSGWFDEAWYLRRYPDLQQVEIDAFSHWWSVGAAEGRDPEPGFSASGYCYALESSGAGDEHREVIGNPLLHYLASQSGRGSTPVVPAGAGPVIKHGLREKAGCPWLMLIGHQAGLQLYGAERSLQDLVVSLSGLPLNVLLVLPEAHNRAYVAALAASCQALAIVPMAWRQGGAEDVPATVEELAALGRQFQVAAVYVNTLVLSEPFAAARRLGVPSVVHLRELPGQDPELCDRLSAEPRQVLEWGATCADRFIANSEYLASRYCAVPGAAPHSVVPNVVPLDRFRDLPWPVANRFAVAMISSNLRKKGVEDFVALARELERRKAPVDCLLVGPETPLVRSIRGQAPSNFEVVGYQQDPRPVLVRAHLVVNLSHFEESFGRTLLEAMAAGRPVLAYRRGALTELVDHGNSGFLVEPGDWVAAADAIEQLVASPDQAKAMGQAGQTLVINRYNSAAQRQALVGALAALPGNPLRLDAIQ